VRGAECVGEPTIVPGGVVFFPEIEDVVESVDLTLFERAAEKAGLNMIEKEITIDHWCCSFV
jgi:hypothetical protein